MRKQLRSLLGITLLAVSAPCAASAPVALHATEPESIWPRLVKGMRLGGEDRPEVRRFITHYSTNPKYFTAMLARAEPFLHFILEQAEQRKMPTELALLPAIESGWNPHAVSVSSAYGLWQFIPRTGDAYGLRDASNYDARRDPVASTKAALVLLDELHREYRDWPLALAAYNTGGVRVRQAIKTRRSRDFWRLPLPTVTQDYVPRLLAIAALLRRPGHYGVSLPPIIDAAVAEVVALQHDVSLPRALQAAGVKPEVLRTFNPGLRAGDAPTASPTLLLPPADALALRAELAYLSHSRPSPAASPPTAPVKPAFARLASHMRWDTRLDAADSPTGSRASINYQVRPGDTLFVIARTQGIALAELMRMNPGVQASSLRAGQVLKLNGCFSLSCG